MAMQGDAETLKRDGFVIVRDCVAPADLDAARATWEALLDRQREVWAREAGPGKASAWERGAQPRLGLPELVAATQNDPNPVAQVLLQLPRTCLHHLQRAMPLAPVEKLAACATIPHSLNSTADVSTSDARVHTGGRVLLGADDAGRVGAADAFAPGGAGRGRASPDLDDVLPSRRPRAC